VKVIWAIENAEAEIRLWPSAVILAPLRKPSEQKNKLKDAANLRLSEWGVNLPKRFGCAD
jgi:hypothetical protein